MEESNDVQALEKISSEVDESQVKVILSSQCIKAQAFLLDKLKKQSERHKETCSFISSANLKVETEIKQAEQEIRSMLIAQDTLKSANVEIKKDWLLAKTRKADIIDRVKEGKTKYEALWLECKSRYESIPFVQKLLEVTEKQKKFELDIVELDRCMINLYDDMESRRKHCAEVDKNRCIELANFMVYEVPKAGKIIKENTEMIHNLTKELELLKEEDKRMQTVITAEVKKISDNNLIRNIDEALVDIPNISKNDDDALIPKLNLVNFDLDIIDVNLDQVRITKEEILNTIPIETNPTLHNFEKIVEQRLENEKAYDYIISPYFKPYKEDAPRNFSERKLINILEDININEGEVYNIVKKVNTEQLKAVREISAESVENGKVTSSSPINKDDNPNESEDIEEMSSSNAEHIIIPPTQFLDITLLSQDDTPRKRVSFDLPSSVQINEITDDDKQEHVDANESLNQIVNSQLDISAGSDENYTKFREMILKKHNLDLSPQFVYAKNNILQKKDDDKIVTSKFFQSHCVENEDDEPNDNAMEVDDQPRVADVDEVLNSQNGVASQIDDNDVLMPMDLDDVDVTSPKQAIPSKEQTTEKEITGLLFKHGGQSIPDSLNVSMSTTGFEDSDFPHCIDSSLLLSPKADIPATSDNPEVLSQEVPNFLSGFRKTGFSFFGGPSTSSGSKSDTKAQNEANDNFSFNFGGEKKNRGGLFSLFR